MADEVVAYDGPIVTRAEAREMGLPRYFTGKPCPHGHVAERFTSGGGCRECLRLRFEEKRRSEGIGPRISQPRDEFLSKRRVLNIRWKEKNRSRLASEARKYYLEHKDECDARSRRSARLNPEAAKERARRRRAKKKGASGSHTSAEISRLAVLQKYHCANCKISIRTGWHIDHIMPLSKGGADGIENIQLLCAPCNHSKHALDPIEWAHRNGRLL